MLHRLAGLALLATLSLPWGPAARALDLVDLFHLAQTNDPVYLAALASHRATLETRPQARAALLPSLDLNAYASANHQDVRRATSDNIALGEEHFSENQLRLTLTQPLYRRDLYIALGQARQAISRADAVLELAHQDLMEKVAAGYFNMLRRLDELNFARSEQKAFGQQLQQIQERFEVGLIAITDVEEARAGFDLGRARAIAAENNLDTAREVLREITGQYYRSLQGLQDTIPLVTPAPPDMDAWTDTALKQNLRVTLSRLDADIAREEIRRIKAGHLPTLDLIGEHRRSDSSGGLNGGNTNHNNSLTLRLSVPVYQGGAVLSRTRQSLHLHRQALDELEQRKRQAIRETRSAYLGIRSGISRIAALKQAVKSNLAAVDAIEAGFQVGTRTSVDVLNARRELFRARRDHTVARYEYLLDTLRLKKAAGTLSPEDLALINGWLQ